MGVPQFVKLLIASPPTVRLLLGASLQTGAFSAAAQKSLASSDNSEGASRAAARLSAHIEHVLDGEPPGIAEVGFSRYLEKIRELKESHLPSPPDGFTMFQRDGRVWELIETAARHSAAAYRDTPKDYSGLSTRRHNVLRHVKIIRAEVVDVADEAVIVVAFRGSASLDDWLLNLNGDAVVDNSGEMLDESRMWHHGFLHSFKASEALVADLISKIRVKAPLAKQILFTGHSAGGAIAQLCYNALRSADSELGKSNTGLANISCVTFGAPPVSTTALAPLPTPAGVFLTLINEGDPVPLAQEGSIKALLSLWLLSPEQFQRRYPLGFDVPFAVLRVSGTCVVLRDTNDDGEEEVVEAVQSTAEDVERCLFGNFLLHFMDPYLRRVSRLAEETRG